MTPAKARREAAAAALLLFDDGCSSCELAPADRTNEAGALALLTLQHAQMLRALFLAIQETAPEDKDGFVIALARLRALTADQLARKVSGKYPAELGIVLHGLAKS